MTVPVQDSGVGAPRSPTTRRSRHGASGLPVRASAATCAPTAALGLATQNLADLAAILARGALRALRVREQKALALLAESEPSCVRAENARRTDRDGRAGDTP